MKFGFDMQNMNKRRDVVILVLLELAETGLSKDTTFIDLMHGVKKLCLSWRFLIRKLNKLLSSTIDVFEMGTSTAKAG
jgi:hypothetical protein